LDGIYTHFKCVYIFTSPNGDVIFLNII
jgi:hypothetical protein